MISLGLPPEEPSHLTCEGRDKDLASALDFVRFDAIEQYADLAASYWRSIAEAASRREGLTIEGRCRQVAAVTREAFQTVKTLTSGPDGSRRGA